MEENFARRLKRVREERRYNQQQLADIARVSVHTIRNYVQEVIIRYCQNRDKFKNLYNLKDGMLLEIEN